MFEKHKRWAMLAPLLAAGAAAVSAAPEAVRRTVCEPRWA
jgi:hypothetical protein